MLGIPQRLLTLAAMGLQLSPQHVRAAPPQSDARSEDDVRITASRPHATRVDYRFRGAVIAYCGARDAHQDASAVAAICGVLRTCASGGARAPEALSDCVEAKRAARARQNNIAPPATSRTSGE